MISMIFSRSMIRTNLLHRLVQCIRYSTFIMLFDQYFWKKRGVRLAYPKVAVARERNLCA